MSQNDTSHDPSIEPVRAAMLVSSAMLLFGIMDATSKFLTGTLEPVQIVWGRYLFFLLFLAPFALWAGGLRGLRTVNPRLQVIRGALMLCSALAFVWSLSALPLALATAISFASPFFTTGLSAIFLGETVRARRWAATAVGFAGVVIILRPGGAAFEIAMLLPILSAFCWACGLVITRKMGRDEQPMTTLLYTALVGFAGVSILLPAVWAPPELTDWMLMAALGALNAGGQFVLIAGFQRAPASMLAPFSYSTMIWAVVLGLAIFGTFPDMATWIGTAVIVVSGLYIWHRERVLYRPPTVPNAAIAGAKRIGVAAQ